MKPAVLLAPVLAVTVGALIWAEFAERPRLVYVFKPLSTLLVIAACALAFLDPAHNPTYALGALVGLVLSLGGDVALMFHDSRRAFLVGLVLFLLAHVAYTVVFTALGRSSGWDIVSGAVLLAAGAGFYALIRPNLGAMRVPVLAYMVVISVMVNRAVSALASPVFGAGQAAMVAVGAVLFYVSDVILAAARFWKPWRYHRISLAFYYAGQFLIALAASYFG
ncbi:MAG: lysoplasmalogenase [Anaerolineales bacterium]